MANNISLAANINPKVLFTNTNEDIQQNTQYRESCEMRNNQYADCYSNYKVVVYKSLLAKGLDEEQAEEIIQDVFVKLLSLDPDKMPNYLNSYTYKIAHNLAIDFFRRNNSAPFVALNTEQERSLEVQEKSYTHSAEESAQMKQTALSIKEALEELPEKCRLAFQLYKLRGLSYERVAEIMGISQSMVRKYVLRAMRHCYDFIGVEG